MLGGPVDVLDAAGWRSVANRDDRRHEDHDDRHGEQDDEDHIREDSAMNSDRIVRLAIGGIEHETNTFAVDSTGMTTLDDFHHVAGDRLLSARGQRTAIGGMLDEADERGLEAVPTYYAQATPSGTIEASAYQAMKTRLVDAISAATPVDAVLLDLHGAGVAEGIDDLEADLVAAVREAVGAGVVIGATFDLHGNVTQDMADHLDLGLGCHLYPHVDLYDRGRELVVLAEKAIAGEIRPVVEVVRLPLILPTSTTDEEPAATTNVRCAVAEEGEGVIDATFFHGFSHTDAGPAGASIMVTTDGDRQLARLVGQEVAGDLWARRASFIAEPVGAEGAVAAARRVVGAGGTALIHDTSDNPGGGSPGDGTHLLRAMYEADLDMACFGFVYDAAAVEACARAGVGNRTRLSIGGHHDAVHGDPIEVDVYVAALTDGRIVYSNPMLAGVHQKLGPTARVRLLGPRGWRFGVDVILTSVRQQTFDDGILALHGIDVATYPVVALKSSSHFRAGFGHLDTTIITADTPGLTSRRLDAFEYERLDGPRWPIDPDTTLPW